jgi:hypothetical protein
MGAAAAPIAMGGQIASMGLSAYGKYVGGKGTQAADEYKAASLERSAQYGRLKASETSAQLLEHTNETLGNIDAIRVAAHTDPTSPTGAAVSDTQEYLGARARSIAVLNIQSQVDQEEADAEYLRKAGRFAFQMGELGAAASLFGGFAKGDAGNFGVGASKG